MCVFMPVDLTLWFDLLSVSHQTVFEVCSSADDGITADHTALDVTPGNHTHTHTHYINHIQLIFPIAAVPKLGVETPHGVQR